MNADWADLKDLRGYLQTNNGCSKRCYFILTFRNGLSNTKK